MHHTEANLKTQHLLTVNRFFLPVLWILCAIGLGLATLHDTWGAALLVGIPAAVLPTVCILLKPQALFTRLLVAASLMVFCALHIHQAYGTTELHFGVFVLLAFLVFYQDWRVIVAAAAVIAVHHLLFNFLQEMQYGPMCLTAPDLGLIVLHAVYVVIESAALCYLAVTLDRKSAREHDGQEALQESFESIRATVGKANTGIHAMTAASRDIARGNGELSQRTESQAQDLVQAVAAVDRLATTVNKNAGDAQTAHQLVKTASSVAEQGGGLVTQVVDTMAVIKENSRKIVDIIGVIDGIAFQTNILALNAAVEAARAGTEGRGFAVVASEVRSLAQRSAGAAQDVKNLINTSVSNVVAGSKLVDETGQAMEQLVTSVRQAADIMSEIAAASQHQSESIRHVHEVIASMDKATQQNAALVLQAANSSTSLQSNAEALATLMSAVTVGGAAAKQPADADRPSREPAVA